MRRIAVVCSAEEFKKFTDEQTVGVANRDGAWYNEETDTEYIHAYSFDRVDGLILDGVIGHGPFESVDKKLLEQVRSRVRPQHVKES